jgi:hypothetical protein
METTAHKRRTRATQRLKTDSHLDFQVSIAVKDVSVTAGDWLRRRASPPRHLRLRCTKDATSQRHALTFHNLLVGGRIRETWRTGCK